MCGSTKFKQQYEEANKALTLKGHIVLSVSCFCHADNLELDEIDKRRLDQIHLRKIDLSDAIYVLDIDNYIGESTTKEIEYAQKNRKKVYYYNKEHHLVQNLFQKVFPYRDDGNYVNGEGLLRIADVKDSIQDFLDTIKTDGNTYSEIVENAVKILSREFANKCVKLPKEVSGKDLATFL